MFLSAKTLLCLAGASGGCCAIGVPVAVSFGNRKVDRQAKIVKCDGPADKELVSFKDQTKRVLCYKLDSSDVSEAHQGENDNNELPREVLNLLGDVGFMESDNGVRTNKAGYSTECIKGDSKGKISSFDNRVIVGSCTDGSVGNDRDSVFLEVPNNQSSSTNIQVCLSGKECGTDDIKPDIITSYTSKSSTFGKTLNFYMK